MFHLRHTKYSNHAQPRFQPRNCFILKNFQTFSTFTQYMSVSNGHSTLGGIEYNGGCVEKTKKEKLSGCASNLLAHEDLGNFEEAHHWNIQAKFYNVKFPLVYESDNIGYSLS